MDPNMLEIDKVYKTVKSVKVCFYDQDDCLMADMVDLQPGTELTYVGPDADDDDGYVFTNTEGTKLCLHDNDLYAIE